MSLPEGGKLLLSRLSEMFDSAHQMENALQRIRQQYPDARGIMVQTLG